MEIAGIIVLITLVAWCCYLWACIAKLAESADNMIESQLHALQCIAILQEQIRRLEQEVKLYMPGGKCH